MNIKDYITVNFFSLEKIIDTLGGVSIDVKQNEIGLINTHMQVVAEAEKTKLTPVTQAGVQNLNGMQAVGYARIRYVGNGDYERTDRQRRVLTALMDKVLTAGATKYPELVSQLLPYVNTSLDKLDILKTGTETLTSGINALDQERFPVDGYCDGKMIKGIYYLTFDEAATKDQLFKYIYEDVKPRAK